MFDVNDCIGVMGCVGVGVAGVGVFRVLKAFKVLLCVVGGGCVVVSVFKFSKLFKVFVDDVVVIGFVGGDVEFGSVRCFFIVGSAGGAFSRSSSRFILVDDGGSVVGVEDLLFIKLLSKFVMVLIGGVVVVGSVGVDCV